MSPKRSANTRQIPELLGAVVRALHALGGSARPQEVYEHVAKDLNVSDAEKAALTSTGVPRLYNRIAWVRLYLVHAGILDSSQRGVWTLTEKGEDTKDLTLAQAKELFRSVREQMPKRKRKRGGSTEAQLEGEGSELDEEQPEEAPTDHRSRVIAVLQALSAGGFERFSQRLLREAGFQNVVVTGRSGDGGIDGMGILRANTLVSFKVLFQCKRYVGSVSSPQVRDFRGAMMGRADKGIMLTTGTFTADARNEAVRDGVPPIELVDGERLADMLEDLALGLIPVKAYKVDDKFFATFDGRPEEGGGLAGRHAAG